MGSNGGGTRRDQIIQVGAWVVVVGVEALALRHQNLQSAESKNSQIQLFDSNGIWKLAVEMEC